MLVLTAGIGALRILATGEPEFLAAWVPATVLLGSGLALTYPMIAAATVRRVEPADLSVASASNRTALQIGNAIGIALVVAILGNPRGPEALAQFHEAWVALVAAGLITTLLVAAVGKNY